MSGKKKVHITTLGCSKNVYDSQIMGGLLEKQGLELTDVPEESEIVIINTCGFIAPAKEESVQAILEAGELKKQGAIRKLLVVGCLSARYREELKKEIPEVDAFFGTEDYANVLKNLKLQVVDRPDYYEARHTEPGSHTSFLKIAEGCNHTCAYCAIPIMRGKYKSRTMDAIVDEAKLLAERGTKELIIISQDTTFYGLDLYKKQMLVPLLEKLEAIDGIEWIRLHYFYPTTIPDGLAEKMAESPKILPYMDIPLQHITDPMLKIMKRGGTRKQIEKLLYEFREKVPGLAIRTTFIVGHPGETETEFEQLVEFVKEFQFERMGAFTYSPEEGTTAFELGDPVPEDVKQARYNALMSVQKEISRKKNEQWLDHTLDVIIDEYMEEGQVYIGRSYMDSPEIDNEVIVYPEKGQSLEIGQIVPVRIFDFEEYELYGRPIQ
jgi:ribosomal protein S12 methylthiotransferase